MEQVSEQAVHGALNYGELERLGLDPGDILVHYEGWAHLVEGRAEIEHAFAEAGLAQRLRFLPFGHPISLTV